MLRLAESYTESPMLPINASLLLSLDRKATMKLRKTPTSLATGKERQSAGKMVDLDVG